MNERYFKPNFKWSKQERLYLKKDIETLFREGKAFSVPCIRVVCHKIDRPEGDWAPVRLGIVVPKKNKKKAVQRNQIKRWIKEAWRVHKNEVYEIVPLTEQWHVFFIFNGMKPYSHAQAMQHVKRIKEHWIKQLSHATKNS